MAAEAALAYARALPDRGDHEAVWQVLLAYRAQLHVLFGQITTALLTADEPSLLGPWRCAYQMGWELTMECNWLAERRKYYQAKDAGVFAACGQWVVVTEQGHLAQCPTREEALAYAAAVGGCCIARRVGHEEEKEGRLDLSFMPSVPQQHVNT